MRQARWARLSSTTFLALTTRNYRLYFIGQLISVSGTWMQTIAQSFLVLRLTHSGSTLGLAMAVRFTPLFLFGPWGGVIADRLDKRRVLYVTQALAGLVAAVFATAVATHVITIFLVYCLSLALGLVNVLDNPTRQSMISEIVPRDELPNAVTLNSVTMNMARVFGGAFGGAIAALLGLAVCFGFNALSFVAVLVTLVMMRRPAGAAPAPAPRAKGQLRDGFRYVRRTPLLLLPLIMIGVIGTLAWEFQISLPLLASSTFHGGAGLYGAMAAVMGAGAVVGGLISASRRRVGARTLAISAIGWGIAITAAALAPTLWLEFVTLLFVGYGSITFNSYAKTTLQLAAAPQMRGRVMALWAVAWQGSTPIGGPIVGWVGEHLGGRWSLLTGGIPTVLIGAVAYPLLTRLDRATATNTPEEPEPVDSAAPTGDSAASTGHIAAPPENSASSTG